MLEFHERVYWIHLGGAGAIAVSILVLIGLGLRLRDTPPPRMHIWAMIAFFIVNIIDKADTLAYVEVESVAGTLYGWSTIFIPGFMIALYFYVRALTSSEPKLHRSDLIHAVPILVGTLCLSPFLSIPGEMRRNFVEGELDSTLEALVGLGGFCFWIVWLLVLVVYGTLCTRRLIIHKRNVRGLFSDLEGKKLLWLDGLVATILILSSIVVIDEIMFMFGNPPLRDGIASMVFELTLSISFGIFALRAEPVLPKWTADVIGAERRQPNPSKTQSPTSPKATSDVSAQRYARSGLQPADIDRIASRLEKRMAEGQLWRKHDLNLRGLAAEIAVPAIHLSEVLNTKLGMTFYDYVNQCRVRDACDLLIKSNETILEISETVGFNAKSTFNTSFRKITDQTPSQWRTRHRP